MLNSTTGLEFHFVEMGAIRHQATGQSNKKHQGQLVVKNNHPKGWQWSKGVKANQIPKGAGRWWPWWNLSPALIFNYDFLFHLKNRQTLYWWRESFSIYDRQRLASLYNELCITKYSTDNQRVASCTPLYIVWDASDWYLTLYKSWCSQISSVYGKLRSVCKLDPV